MRYLRVIWDLADDVDGNIQHIAENDVTPDEVGEILRIADDAQFSRSSGRPLVFGYTEAGRLLAVIFEWVDEDTVYPVTAYEPEE
jgi:uncharacterized DUF497 family protein